MSAARTSVVTPAPDQSRRSVVRGLAVAGAAPFAVAGCGTVGGAYDRLFARPGPKDRPGELVPVRARVNLRVLWQAQVGNSGRYVFSPAIDGAQVYAVGTDGMLGAFELASGRSLWRQQALRPLSGGVGAGNGWVAVGGPDGEVQTFTREGKLAWSAQLTGEVLAAPEIDGGLVVVRTGDARLWGLDAETGKRRWVYQRDGTPSLALRTHVGLTVSRGAVFAGFGNGRLIGLDLKTGNVGLDVAVALPRGATELERMVEVTSLPILDPTQVCAVAFQGRVACFDLARGSINWARDISSIAGLDIDTRSVYVVDERSVVHALDRSSGASLWRQPALQLRSLGAPRVYGRTVVVGDFQGQVHLLDPEDGSFVARIATDGSPISIGARLFDRGFLVQTRNGGVFAIGPG
jgi:outer membrane protein assembly factor BamB